MEWDWWCTLTFRHPRSPEAAQRAWDEWIAAVRFEAEALGSRVVRYFVGQESGRLGRLHLHAVVSHGVKEYFFRGLAEKDWRFRNGIADVQHYDSTQEGCIYIAKYTAKDFTHYDIDPGTGPLNSPLGACSDPLNPLLDTLNTACTNPRIPAGNAGSTRKDHPGRDRSTQKHPRSASKRHALDQFRSPSRAYAGSGGDSGSDYDDLRT